MEEDNNEVPVSSTPVSVDDSDEDSYYDNMEDYLNRKKKASETLKPSKTEVKP